VSGAAREEKLVGAHAYGFDFHFGTMRSRGRTVVCRSTVGFLHRGRDLLGLVLRPPPHRRPIPLPNPSHLFQKTSLRETFPLTDTPYQPRGQGDAGHFKAPAVRSHAETGRPLKHAPCIHS
jgi:hypothetical protein